MDAAKNSVKVPTLRKPKGPLAAAGYLGAALGTLCAMYGVYRVLTGENAIESLAYVFAGVLNITLSLLAAQGKRFAWSFATSLNGTAAFVFFLGIPKVRTGLEVHALIALLPFCAFLTVTVLFAASSDQMQSVE